MKKIVPFKHEVPFKNKISEVTSISLEHTLHKEEDAITGEFIISGDYKRSDTSTTSEYFNFNLPFDIVLDEHYDIENAIIDINDFYYEILNDEKLVINIEVVIDKIVEKLIEVKKQVVTLETEIEKEIELVNLENKEDVFYDKTKVVETKEEVVREDSSVNKEVKEAVENLMNVTDKESEYTTYHIHIVREGDTIDSILEKYSINSESLAFYNNLNELKIGDKLLIPDNEVN